MDDPTNLEREQAVKLEKARIGVEHLWGVGCRKTALETLLRSGQCARFQGVFPVFIPVSARTGFLVRAGTSMTEAEFVDGEGMDSENFNSIGQNHFGRRAWQSMSRREKAAAVYKLLQDPNDHKEFLRMSGFDKFLKCLENSLGGEQAQTGLIRNNFMIELKKENFADGEDLYSVMRRLDDKRQIVNEDQDVLTRKVWDSYRKWKEPALASFEQDCQPEKLGAAAQKLIRYQKFCKEERWTAECQKIETELFRLVQDQLAIINNHANQWSLAAWEVESGAAKKCRWMSLSPVDWLNVMSAILLLRCEPMFCRRFGREIALLEKHQATFQMLASGCGRGCDSLPCSNHPSLLESVKFDLELGKNFKITPKDEASYAQLNKIGIQADYGSNQKHFAHVGWLFCEAHRSQSE